MKSKKLSLVLVLSFLSLLAGCGGGGGGSDGGSSGTGTGTLSLSMTDASSDEYEAVYVTIDEVQIHLGGGESNPNNWQPIVMQRSPITVDLLKLTNGVREQLGIISLPKGEYTQVRLIIGETPEDKNLPYANYVVDKSTPAANIYPLKVPSGTNTGFKIVENFSIGDQQILELVLDFDATKSVIQAGNSGQWLLKPTVKIKNLDEASIVTGQITDKDNKPVTNAMVSAQKYVPINDDNTPRDDKDKVTVETATFTNSTGHYFLFLKLDTYNLVVTAQGKTPDFEKITTTAGSTILDFSLDNLDESKVGGFVNLPDEAGSENYATLSFRQEVTCDKCATGEMIEIKSINVIKDKFYLINLPVNINNESYTLVASSFNYPTQSILLPPVVIEVPDTQTNGNVTF